MNYGLSKNTIVAIKKVLAKYSALKEAVLYGSRAMGNYRYNSDIDLTFKGENLDLSTQFKIESELDDLLLPYKIDTSIYHKIANQDLVDHINQVGVIFYEI